jgi:hypothetical protein
VTYWSTLHVRGNARSKPALVELAVNHIEDLFDLAVRAMEQRQCCGVEKARAPSLERQRTIQAQSHVAPILGAREVAARPREVATN